MTLLKPLLKQEYICPLLFHSGYPFNIVWYGCWQVPCFVTIIYKSSRYLIQPPFIWQKDKHVFAEPVQKTCYASAAAFLFVLKSVFRVLLCQSLYKDSPISDKLLCLARPELVEWKPFWIKKGPDVSARANAAHKLIWFPVWKKNTTLHIGSTNQINNETWNSSHKHVSSSALFL